MGSFGTTRAIVICEWLKEKSKTLRPAEGIEMAIQKKSLISGKSTTKKSTPAMPQVSENPGMTRIAHTKVAATKVAATRVAATRVAATRVAATRVAATRVAATRVAATRVAATRVAATRVKAN